VVNMLARAMRRAAVTALLPLLFLSACSHAAAPVSPPVTLSFCGSDPQMTPTVVEVICNTDDITARNLVWTAWGKLTATAKGTAVVDLCAYTDCHTGAYGDVPIRLIASKIADCAKNTRAYSVLRYVFVNGSPWPGVPADMNTLNYMAAPNRSLPPANQTVSLTCR
jgi:hypothetical protein